MVLVHPSQLPVPAVVAVPRVHYHRAQASPLSPPCPFQVGQQRARRDDSSKMPNRRLVRFVSIRQKYRPPDLQRGAVGSGQKAGGQRNGLGGSDMSVYKFIVRKAITSVLGTNVIFCDDRKKTV